MMDLFFYIIFAALIVKLINCCKRNILTPIAEMLGFGPNNVPNDGLGPTQAGL